MTTKVNVGLLGAGRIGRVHAENLAYRIPEVNLVAVADVYLEAAQKCAADFQIPAVTQDPQTVLNDETIDAVVICSSSDTHAQLITEAANAGKHIFCEKSIALDLDIIDEALTAVEQNGVKLQLGFNRRFDPNFRQARDMVAAGEIGTPHIIHFISRDPAPPPKVFIDCIVQDTSPPVTGLDGRNTAVMGLAAWKSYRENRPVKLSEIW